jgi:hypothetical protein
MNGKSSNPDYITVAKGGDCTPYVLCYRRWFKGDWSGDYITIDTRGPYHRQENAVAAGKKWANERGIEFR